MEEQLNFLIDQAVADGLGEEDIKSLVDLYMTDETFQHKVDSVMKVNATGNQHQDGLIPKQILMY
jgi:hypothetical protein